MEVDELGNTVTRDPSDGTAGGRGDLEPPGGAVTGKTIDSEDCPDECCVEPDENCFRTLDHSGYEVIPDEEVMLVFGGATMRSKLDPDGNPLSESCESWPSED